MPYPGVIDYQNPDYISVLQWRADNLARIRANPTIVPVLKMHYRENPIDFIEDWGMTFDPRALEIGRAPLMPFIPFAKQKDWLQWVIDLWRARENGLSDKSRDMGLTWLASALFCTLALFHNGFIAGFGSRKEDLVDKGGDPDSIFFKVRMFLRYIPEEFRGGWVEENHVHSSHMRIVIPDTGSVIRGEAGDNIGRGGRAAVYLIDESAHLPQPEKVETSLSFTTNCRIDISSVNGMNNPFAEKRHSGRVSVMTMHWRDDPRKGEEWYKKQCAKFSPLVIAQEVDIDYSASVSGVLIPSDWIQACIDADVKLGLECTGAVSTALDVADEGVDLNAQASKRGVRLIDLDGWSGKNSNIYKTTLRVIQKCDELGITAFQYDADGLGVGVRGDAEAINALPAREAMGDVEAIPFRGSGEVVDKDKKPVAAMNKTNADIYKNYKAQSWWHLRTLVENTYKAVVENLVVDLDEIIVIPSDLPNRQQLVAELGQVLFDHDTAGKLLIIKTPDGFKSPNYADAVNILYSPKKSSGGWFDV